MRKMRESHQRGGTRTVCFTGAVPSLPVITHRAQTQVPTTLTPLGTFFA